MNTRIRIEFFLRLKYANGQNGNNNNNNNNNKTKQKNILTNLPDISVYNTDNTNLPRGLNEKKKVGNIKGSLKCLTI